MAGRTAVVVGGGIGGLAAGVALRQRGWRVVVLERAAEFAEVGAGLSVWPNAMRALAGLGLADQVRAVSAAVAEWGVRDRAGRWLSRTAGGEIERRHGWPLLVLRRADLVRVLVGALPSRCLAAGSGMRALHEHGDTVVVEHDGGVLRADLVVGADGVRSDVRRLWWPQARAARESGSVAWRMITEPVSGLGADGAVFWGRGERIGYTALPGGRFYCFAAARVPCQGDGSAHSAAWRRFSGWPEPIPALLAATPADRVLCHGIDELPALSTYARGRVALLGDAAHAMDPALGQGACLAIEDAVTLAVCVDSADGVTGGLRDYDLLRRSRTQAIVRRSARLGAVGALTWPPAALARDLVAKLTPDAAALRAMAPVLDWNPPEFGRVARSAAGFRERARRRALPGRTSPDDAVESAAGGGVDA